MLMGSQHLQKICKLLIQISHAMEIWLLFPYLQILPYIKKIFNLNLICLFCLYLIDKFQKSLLYQLYKIQEHIMVQQELKFLMQPVTLIVQIVRVLCQQTAKLVLLPQQINFYKVLIANLQHVMTHITQILLEFVNYVNKLTVYIVTLLIPPNVQNVIKLQIIFQFKKTEVVLKIVLMDSMKMGFSVQIVTLHV